MRDKGSGPQKYDAYRDKFHLRRRRIERAKRAEGQNLIGKKNQNLITTKKCGKTGRSAKGREMNDTRAITDGTCSDNRILIRETFGTDRLAKKKAQLKSLSVLGQREGTKHAHLARGGYFRGGRPRVKNEPTSNVRPTKQVYESKGQTRSP